MQHVAVKKIPENQVCEIPRWQQLKSKLKNHSPSEFKAQWECHPEAILIDVRTPAEAEGSILKGAVLMYYLGANFLDEMEALDKHLTYFVYCQSGRRSVRTCTMMTNAGFEHLHHLDGGLNAWNRDLSD